MKTNKSNNKERRQFLAVTLGLSAVAASLPKKWQTPILNSVMTPAHAQMTSCAIPMIANASAGPGSGAADCVISFNIFSDGADIDVISITNTAVTAPDAIVYDTFGTATSSSGPLVTWSGVAIGGPTISCNDPLSDVTFTVTYTCDVVAENLTATFTLFDIAAMAV